MSGPLADILFFLAALATAIAQFFILRSTIRGMRAATIGTNRAWEWVWAILPAVTLVALFVFTWSAMHPDSMTFTIPGSRVKRGPLST